MTQEPTSLRDVLNGKRTAEAKDVRQALFAHCRNVLADLGEDVSGFALVIWTRDGDVRSTFDSGYGPIRPTLIPTLAGDALNRHVASVMEPARCGKP